MPKVTLFIYSFTDVINFSIDCSMDVINFLDFILKKVEKYNNPSASAIVNLDNLKRILNHLISF